MNLTVKRVWRDIQGSPLAAAVSIGATSAIVEESVDFDENGGDFVLGVDSGTYTGFNEDTNTVEGLDPPLTVAHPQGTFLQEGERRGPKYADGYLDDSDSVTESVLIPTHLRRFFPLGGREAADMEVVPVALEEDGSLYVTDAPIDEDRADAPVVFTWSLTGNVSVGTRDHRFAMPFGGSIEEVRMVMGDGGAPTGSSIIVDILKGGDSILTDKVVVAAGELSSDPIEPTDKEASKGNIIQIEFEQVGSTLPGSDPTLYMTVFPSETAISGRVEVPGEPGPAGADGADGVITEVQNEGVALADQPIMNFTGAGVDVTVAGGKYVVDVSGGGGGAPTNADYLVGTANGSLSAEIVVGTTPGGELGGTWASPTVDATHSGSSHASVQAAAEATAATALSNHVAAADPHTGYQKESEKGAASGYASLDGSTKVPIAEVPTGTTATTVALGNHTHAQLHDRSHAIDSTSDHTVSGGTSGHVLRQTGATTFAWGAIQDGDLPSTITRDSEAVLRSEVTSAHILTLETTTSTSLTDLTTTGPSVTLTTGTAVLLFITSYLDNLTAGNGAQMAVAVSGATTRAADTTEALSFVSSTGSQGLRATHVLPITGLTAGSNTFTPKYRATSGGTARFSNRRITVIPL